MRRSLIASMMMLMLMSGCKEDSKSGDGVSGKMSEKVSSFESEFSDGNFKFQLEYNNRKDSSYCVVSFRGKSLSRIRLGGEIKKHFLVDLNKDRKNELYLVAEDNESAKLYGYNYSGGEAIHIEISNPKKPMQTNMSTFEFERNQIIERFKFKSTEGSEEIGESRYNLLKKGDKLILLPQGWQPFELENLSGQYSIRNDENSGISKTLLIGEREGGKWKVNIKVRRNNSNTILCEFDGLGEYVDKDLFVPLSPSDPTIKGTLKIQFVDAYATVYTENHADYKEMNTICEGKGSIAGNFKKTEI